MKLIKTYVWLYVLLCITTNAYALSPWTKMDLHPTIDTLDHSKDNQALISVDDALKGADFRCRWIWQSHSMHNFSKAQLQEKFMAISRDYNVLVSVCCYCGMYIRVQRLQGGTPGISHGICEFDCERLFADMDDMKSEKVTTEVDNDKVMGGA